MRVLKLGYVSSRIPMVSSVGFSKLRFVPVGNCVQAFCQLAHSRTSDVYRCGSRTAHTVSPTIDALQTRPGSSSIKSSQATRPYSSKAHTFDKELLSLDDEEANTSSKALGRKKLLASGFDPQSLYEQVIVWGDLDSFRHVNNVRYVRFLESARIVWMHTLGLELDGPERSANMLAGKGVSLILKDITVRFRRPVFYPDTLLIAHKPHDPHPTHFSCAAAIWSYAQRTIIATSDSTLVWYDYDKLTKCNPGPQTHAVLQKRIDLGLQDQKEDS